jgi:hypothetical protein
MTNITGTCASCSRIDFDLLLCPTRDELDALSNYNPNGFNTTWKTQTFQKYTQLKSRSQNRLQLGSLREISQRAGVADCGVCVLLWKVLRRYHHGADPPFTWRGRELICFSSIKVYGSFPAGNDLSQSFNIQRLSLLVEVPCQGLGDYTGDSQYDIEFCVQAASPRVNVTPMEMELWIHATKQWVTVAETLPDTGIPSITPQDGGFGGRRRPPLVDGAMVARWIQTCGEEHDCELTLYGELDCPGMRVVDIRRRCLVPADSVPGLKYVALSYCWGEGGKKLTLTSANYSVLHEEGSLNASLLPRTIADAIHFLSGIDVDYLWVDALCIQQDSDKDKAQQISKMHLIYNNATFTLIVASGVEMDSGLPGLSTSGSGPRSEQETATILRRARGVCTDISAFMLTLMATLSPQKIDLDHFLEQTPWYKRGWTMQERVLSHRNLIFTGEQVYWECKSASWCEESGFDTGNLRVFRRAREPSVHLSEQEKDAWIRRRRARERQDVDSGHPWTALAASSMSSKEARGEFLGHYGYLVMRYSQRVFGQEEDVFVGYSGIASAVSKVHGEEIIWGLMRSCFEQALLWWGWSGPRRPVKCRVPSATGDGFDLVRIPSWSWMAWRGPVQTSHSGPNPQVVCYRMTPSGLGKVCEVHDKNFPRNGDDGVVKKRPWMPLNSLEVTEDELRQLHPGLVAHPDVLSGSVLFFWASTARFTLEWEGDPRKGGIPILKNKDGSYAGIMMQCNGDWWLEENLNGSEGEFVVVSILDPEKGSQANLQLLHLEQQDGIAYRMNVGIVEEHVWVKANPTLELIALG